MSLYTGKQQIAFNKRLGTSWRDLALYFDIPAAIQDGFTKGDEPSQIWKWLDERAKLDELPEALRYIDREDIVLQVLAPIRNKATEKQKTWQGSPFPGLRDFTEQESAIFFGREQETSELLQFLGKSRFIAVVGASGSGKSSLVRAGVIPRLHEIEKGICRQWLRFTPGGLGDNPFLALAAKLEPVYLQGRSLNGLEISEALYNRGNLAELVEAWFPQNQENNQMLLFIDQFEELFTLTNPDYRQRFIAMLEKAVQSSHIRIILTVRADFMDHCLAFAGLAQFDEQRYLYARAPDHERPL